MQRDTSGGRNATISWPPIQIRIVPLLRLSQTFSSFLGPRRTPASLRTLVVVFCFPILSFFPMCMFGYVSGFVRYLFSYLSIFCGSLVSQKSATGHTRSNNNQQRRHKVSGVTPTAQQVTHDKKHLRRSAEHCTRRCFFCRAGLAEIQAVGEACDRCC